MATSLSHAFLIFLLSFLSWRRKLRSVLNQSCLLSKMPSLERERERQLRKLIMFSRERTRHSSPPSIPSFLFGNNNSQIRLLSWGNFSSRLFFPLFLQYIQYFRSRDVRSGDEKRVKVALDSSTDSSFRLLCLQTCCVLADRWSCSCSLVLHDLSWSTKRRVVEKKKACFRVH